MGLSNDYTFTLTADHVTLLRAMYVGWCDDEFGAPEINPKRPYGNSDVIRDIHDLLEGDRTGKSWDEDHHMPSGMTPDEWRGRQLALTELHRETERALQVVLATGSFEPGDYRAPAYTQRWEPV